MKIIGLKKISNNRYKIKLDDIDLVLYEDVILDNNLLYKKEIDNELLKKIIKENEYYDSYNKVLKYVVRKMRSVYEVEVYMTKLELKDKDKKTIIKKLKDINLLNDKLYVSAFISDKINLSNDGPLKIKKELLDNKIDEDIIDEELSNYDVSIFEEKIKKLINKKNNNKYSNYIFKQKVLSYLTGLGYDSNFVIPIIDNMDMDTSSIVQKEYDNLYKKLSKKYSDNKLDYEIKSRLYRKGFNMDEINSITKE